MAIKSDELTTYLKSYAPLILADDWDNVGFQIGDDNQPIKTLMTALELTDAVIDEAIALNADYIITHHPILFRPFTSIVEQNAKQRLARRLIKNDINYYAMHTNFDYLTTGTSDLMAKQIGLKNIQPLLSETRGDIDCALGKLGELDEEITAESLAKKLCQIYDSQAIKYSAPKNKQIKKVAVISGSGMGYIDDVSKFGVDAFITGDVTYHAVMDSLHYGMAIYDAGHFESEVIFSSALAKHLKQIATDKNWDIKITASKTESTPFRFETL